MIVGNQSNTLYTLMLRDLNKGIERQITDLKLNFF
jgi:hypothetical protein